MILDTAGASKVDQNNNADISLGDAELLSSPSTDGLLHETHQTRCVGADSAIVEARLISSTLDSPVALTSCVPLANMGGREREQVLSWVWARSKLKQVD
jgi:hypothetical protein